LIKSEQVIAFCLTQTSVFGAAAKHIKLFWHLAKGGDKRPLNCVRFLRRTLCNNRKYKEVRFHQRPQALFGKSTDTGET
jgi:hypothetical protein